MRRLLFLTVFAIGALHTTRAHAQADSARVAAARRFLDAAGTVDAMLAVMRANMPMQRASNPQVPAEFWTRFEARITQEAPHLADSIAVLYARNFSREDLDALAAFYKSPVGVKLRGLQPALLTESSGIGQRWGMRIGAEIGAALQAK